MIFKKEDLEEFLFLWSKAENIPFTNYEDALVNNYSVLDKPFNDYSQIIIGWNKYLKAEISENLLSLTSEDRDLYLNYIKNRLENETWYQENDKLICLLRTLDINTDNLSFENNKKLYDVLNLSFKEFSSQEDLTKFKQLHHEYYLYLLNIERNIVIEYLQELNRNKLTSPDKSYKNEVWFKFGVQLASGNLRKYYVVKKNGTFGINEGYSARIIAKELNIPNNMVSATFSGYSIDSKNFNKNIFNDSFKTSKIKEHCEENNINIVSEFLKRTPTE